MSVIMSVNDLYYIKLPSCKERLMTSRWISTQPASGRNPNT
jgi:hypothetical protein